ncbi:MAG: hypothetical protein GF355_17335 [Candidatus Eisenbacteria bacterium]|nr:hypothetical protein [Candidatus Eisenbacteria bacterium]
MPSRRLALILILLIPLCGCEEDEDCPVIPEAPITISNLFFFPESVGVGELVGLEVVAAGEELAYEWAATAGTYPDDEGTVALWKAPDTPGAARLTVVVTNPEGSASRSVTVAVGAYVPREVPHYLGQATCGECHFDDPEFGQWQGSAHARAWEDMRESGEEDDVCYYCHTTGYDDRDEFDNPLDNGGYDDMPTQQRTDAQCESCHGPLGDPNGLSGIVNHDYLRQGPALMGVGVFENRTGCGTCHVGYHNDYEPEWRASGHAESHLAEGAADDPSCTPCHTAEGYVDAFVRGTGAETYGDGTLPVNCVVCHDPHDPTHPGMLRAAQPDGVCADCHTLDETLPGNLPHHPQLDILRGTGAVEFSGSNYENTPHRAVTIDLCATCHVSRRPYEDPNAPGYTYHEYTPRPENCVDCHPSAEGVEDLDALDFLIPARVTTDSLLAVLQDELDAAESDTTQMYRDALYNLRLVESDGSRGGHNFAYVRSVLEATIENFEP